MSEFFWWLNGWVLWLSPFFNLIVLAIFLYQIWRNEKVYREQCGCGGCKNERKHEE